jgi:uncharacterized repeat protein (TIGR02543 family)
VVTNNAGESRSVRYWITVNPSLTENVWANGDITDADGEDWYLLSVSSGTTYYIWWNDRKQGNETKNGDVVVSARYVGSNSWIFGGTSTTVDSGWSSAQSFTANQTGMVYIRVIPFTDTNGIGAYGIVYSTSNTRPVIYTVTFNANNGSGTTPAAQMVNPGSNIILPDGSGLSRSGYTFGGWNTNSSGTGTNYNVGASYTPSYSVTLYAKWNIITTLLTANVWANGSITSSATTREIWYSFSVISGQTYYVWWNDSYEGNGTKTLNVEVSAQYSNGTSIFSGINSAYNTARTFTANQTGTVCLIVRPYFIGNTGTYGIVYSTSATRPAP